MLTNEKLFLRTLCRAFVILLWFYIDSKNKQNEGEGEQVICQFQVHVASRWSLCAEVVFAAAT